MSYYGDYTPLTYERIKNKHARTQPYRGTENYPYVTRTHRHKFFVPVEVNGEIEYHMNYYWGYRKDLMSHAEYEQASQYMSNSQKRKWSIASPEYNEGQSFYYKYTKISEPYGILRKDNTLEITSTDMHQGLRMHLTDMLRGIYVMTDCLSGGAIITDTWRESSRRLKIPLFKGLRFNTETFEIHESSRFLIDVKRVDRTKSTKVMKERKDKFDLIKAFSKTMTKEVFVEEMKNIAQEYKIFKDDRTHYLRPDADDISIKQFDENPMDSMYLTLITKAVSNSRWIARDGDNTYYDPSWYAHKAEQHIKHNLKHLHDTFNHVKYWDFDKVYPQSRWDIEITDMQGNKIRQL